MEIKRLIIDLPEKDHTYIKKCAAERGIYIKNFVLKAIAEYLIKIKKYDEK